MFDSTNGMRSFKSSIGRPLKKYFHQAKGVLMYLLLAAALVAPLGCRKPEMPGLSSLSGPGRLKDITEVRRGMSPNEVRRVMGNNYKTIYEEGMQGMDMGIYIWEYPEGRVYFNTNGAFKAVPFK